MRNAGFSLIEVMVAMAILAIGMAATAPLLTLSITRGAEARKTTTAQQLAQDLLERLRSEVRYDGEGASPATLAAADAWKYDVLPHAPDTGTGGAGCQPTGHDDGVAYDYGPFVFLREDQEFSVCYALTEISPTDPARAGLPLRSMDVRVRVIWRGAGGGVSTWSLSDLLVNGV